MSGRIILMTICMTLTYSQGQAAEPIPIGVFLSLSGNVQWEGRQAWLGIQTAHKMRPTVLGRPIVLKTADTQSETVMGARAMFRLIERDRVVAVIGDVTAKTTLAGSTLAVRKHIPIVCLTSSDCLGGPARKLVFGVFTPAQNKARTAADLMRNHFHARTAAVLVDVGQYECLRTAHFFKRWFSRLGGKVAGAVRIRTAEKDFTAQLNEIKKMDADMIFVATYVTESAFFVKQARTEGITIPILSSAPAIRSSDGSPAAGDPQNVWYIEDLADTAPRNETGRQLSRSLKADVGFDVSRHAVLAAEAYFGVIDAISRAGRCDSSDIRDALGRICFGKTVKGSIVRRQRHIQLGRRAGTYESTEEYSRK